MEKLKVLHISETFIGGVYTYLRQLNHYSQSDGHFKTYIIYSADREETNTEAIGNDFAADTELICIDMTREISLFRDLRSTLKIMSLIRKIQPDIIHLHSSKAGVLGRVANFLLFRKRILFYTPHGYSFLRTDISTFKKKLYWSIEKSFQMLFKGETVACGDTEYEIASEIGKSSLVRNGIDIEEVQKGFNENENQILKIGITGRIAYQRNPQLFNQIALKFPDYQFVWIGDGDLRTQLTAPNIRITGWIGDRNMLLKEVNDLDLYLHTSIWEGLPIAILEAMALEKPVIATNVIGNKDIVSHNETGFLFNEIDELDDYFEALKHKNQRVAFGKKALERCRLLFDINKNFRQLLSIYEDRLSCK